MNFFCSNQTCAISISKASFPISMNCPVCQNPLQEEVIESTISLDEQLLISQLPYVIAYPFKRMLEEPDGRNKLELLAYTFLNGLKYLGLVIASEYFNSPLKSAKINEQFRNNLFQPSFGNWNAFLREAIICLDSQNQLLIFPEIKEIYKKLELAKSAKKYKTESQYTDEDGLVAWKKSELTAIGTLINFRNRYLGHGVPLSKEEYESLFKVISPVLINFLSEWKAIDHITMIRSEAKESWQMMGAEISLISNNSPNKKSNVYLSHLDGRNLELIPFYVLPKQFSAGASDKAQIQVYEQNTGQRIIFYSPESIKSEASGEILERFKILLEKKEQEENFSHEQFSIEILRNQIRIYNSKIFDGLIKEKKLIEGIYQPRVDSETELMSWINSKAGLFILAAEAGSGKTNLLYHMVSRYENTGFNSILMRSIRTNGTDLEKEIKELLNVDNQFDLPTFISNHFSQENPLIILIDGGNEHQEPPVFLKSILQFISKTTLGSLKVVLSWRISTLNDLPQIDKNYDSILYETGVSNDESKDAYKAFLLKGLSKIEIEGAWDFYKAHSSKLYRPNFLFRDLLAFDSLLVEELSNPLLLRLFMELYSGKSLPMASEGFINLWELWWKQLQKNVEESRYLVELAGFMISKNSLQVSLDELFDVPQLSDAVKNIQIDSPHQQLIRKGILSQFFQHNTLQVSFTMEASFHYVVSRNLNLNLALKQFKNNSFWKESIKYFLWDKVANKDNLLLFELIDSEEFPNDLAVLALTQRITLFGAKDTLNHLFMNETKDDWDVLKQSFRFIKESRPKSTVEFADQILIHCETGLNDSNRLIAIELLSKASKSKADIFFEKFIKEENLEDVKEITALAKYFNEYGKINKSADLFEKAITLLPVNSNLLGSILMNIAICQTQLMNLDFAWESIIKAELFYKSKLIYSYKVEGVLLNLKGMVKERQGLFSEALVYYQNAYHLNKVNQGLFHEETIKNQINIGGIQSHLGNYDLALEEYEKTLILNIQFYGDTYPNVAESLSRIGDIWTTKGDYDKALEYYERAMAIELQYYGESHPNVAASLDRIGDIWETKGDYDKALEYYERAMTIQLKYFGESHPDVAASLNRIGDICTTQGDYGKALEYYERAMAIRLQYYGELHPNVAASLDRIGDIWETKGDYDKALEYYERAMTIRLQNYGESHPNVTNSYDRIGDVRKTKGDYDKALEYYERAMAILLQYYGESHPNVASSLNRIGDICKIKGDYDKALEYYERAMTIQLKYFGESHPNVGSSLNLIGDIWETKGDYNKALEYYERAMTIRLQYYGESHPNVASSLDRIGDICTTQSDYGKALEYYERAMAIRLQYYGESHPNVAASLDRIGDICKIKGDYDKALEYYERAMAILLQYYGELHPNVALSLNRIGDICTTQGDYGKALEYYERAMAIRLQYYGESHPNVASSLNRIGDICDTQGDYGKALEYFERAMTIRLQYYGESNPNVAASLNCIGDIWKTKGDYDKALEYYERAMAIRLLYYGESHPKMAESLDRIGVIFKTKGDYDKALEYYERAMAILLQYYGESHPNVAPLLDHIGDICDTKGDYNKALEYFERAMAIRLKYYGELHPNVVSSLNRIGDICDTKGDYDKALEYFERAMAIRLQYYGELHPNIASSLSRIGDICKTKGDYDKALEYFERAMAIQLQYYGESHPKVARSLNIIGNIFEKKCDYLNAYLNNNKSLTIFENYVGENHTNVGAIKRNVGKALIGLGDFIQAKEMLEASVAILLQNQVESDPKLARTYLILAKCLRLQKDIEPAQKIIEKAKEIFEKNFGDSHVESANAYFENGCLLVDMDNLIEAQVYFKKCYDVRSTILGPEHVDTIEVQEKLSI
jgi:tetratricopeptide (TPR) repeat protein